MAIMYTPAQMTAEVRTLLGEPTARFFTDAEIQLWLDRAARHVSAIGLCVPISETVTTTLGGAVGNTTFGTFSYALTTKFVKIHSVMFNATTALERLDIRNFGHGAAGASATNQSPQWYFVHGDRIYLWPPAMGTSVGANVIVYGWRTAFAFENDTGGSPKQYEVPDVLQPIMIEFIMACARSKEGKHGLVSYHMRKFLSKMNIYRRDYHDTSLVVDSSDRFMIPDRTQVAGQAG